MTQKMTVEEYVLTLSKTIEKDLMLMAKADIVTTLVFLRRVFARLQGRIFHVLRRSSTKTGKKMSAIFSENLK